MKIAWSGERGQAKLVAISASNIYLFCPHILVHLGWHIFFHANIHIRHRLVGRLGLGLCGVPLEGIPVVSHEKYQDACSVVEHRTLPPHCD